MYMAVPGEVGTGEIRSRYLDGGMHLFYPRVMENGTLRFFPDGGVDGWVRGKYGLLEPRISPGEEGRVDGFDLVVVPGLAFDSMGRRLGKGFGYYDRFLSGRTARTMSVGLAFSYQILPEVPVDPWDMPVDVVVTEEGVMPIARDGAIGHIK